MNKRLTNILLLISLSISIGIIIVLLFALSISEKRLEKIGDLMNEMATQHIITTVSIKENIPLNSDIRVTDELKVNIKMFLQTEIPFKAEIPVSENMLIPFKIGLHDYIKIDTTIEVTDFVNILVDDTIPLNQKMNMAIFGGKGFNFPIKGKIPVQQTLKIGFNELLPVHSVVPIDMLIIDTLPVGLSMKIPVDLMVPVNIPLETTALIKFDEAMSVDAEIPIELNIPIDIPLEKTSLAFYFKKMAEGLKGLTKFPSDEEGD